jgi:hypothetical protein
MRRNRSSESRRWPWRDGGTTTALAAKAAHLLAQAFLLRALAFAIGTLPIGVVCRLAARKVDVLVNGTLVPIVWDTPMEGVARPWFACPVCGRRCRHVYLLDSIGCKTCCRLDHVSRHLRRQTPGVGRVERLRRRLGNCDTRPFAPLPARRPGRSKAYHERMVAMIQNEEAKLVEHLGGIVRDLQRRIRVRKSKGKW